MKNLKDLFDDLSDGIVANLVTKLVVTFLKYSHKTFAEEKAKYWIDYSIYIFFTKINFYFFVLIFPLYGILISLFDPNYTAMPRFLAAYIMLGVGLTTTVILKHVNSGWIKPLKTH